MWWLTLARIGCLPAMCSSGLCRVPAGTRGALDYGARCRQVRALGGDCYDFMTLTDDRLALVVGDASGKGLAAALMMASVQSSLRTAALFTANDLAALLKIVNIQAYNSSAADRYATLFYGVFDRAARTLRYVNAGHNPPAVLRDDGSVHWLEPSGAPVGMFPDSGYEESWPSAESWRSGHRLHGWSRRSDQSRGRRVGRAGPLESGVPPGRRGATEALKTWFNGSSTPWTNSPAAARQMMRR